MLHTTYMWGAVDGDLCACIFGEKAWGNMPKCKNSIIWEKNGSLFHAISTAQGSSNNIKTQLRVHVIFFPKRLVLEIANNLA